MPKPPLSKAKRPLILTPYSPLDETLKVFKEGGVISYPTETFYGLGVDPFNPRAVNALFKLKHRPESKPVSLLIKNLEMLGSVVAEVSVNAETLIKKFWPGPLTIIFKASPAVPSTITAGTGTVAVRISSCGVAQKLLNTLNSPITATSANPSAEPASKTPQEILNYFNGAIDILIDNGELAGRLGTTIVDATGPYVKIVREGEIPSSEVLNALKT